MSTDRDYPHIVKEPRKDRFSRDRWVSQEQMDGTPDFIIELVDAKDRNDPSNPREVRVKWRSSSKAMRFRGINEAKRHLRDYA